jgi:hypothetical protein
MSAVPGGVLSAQRAAGDPGPGGAASRDAGGRLILKPQPAYAPELNPQERIWKGWRRVVTHHHGFVTRKEHIDAIRNFFRSLAGGKDHVPQ